MSKIQADRIHKVNDEFVKIMNEASKNHKSYNLDQLMYGCAVPVPELRNVEVCDDWRQQMLDNPPWRCK